MYLKMIGLLFISSLFIIFFYYLIQQSRLPKGKIGSLMMKIWNRSYLPMVRWTLSETNMMPETILDIGVGNGASTKLLKDFFPSAEISGIDLSRDAIQLATNSFAESDLNFTEMDVHQMKFSTDSFDLITAYQTHFHWDNLEKALTEIQRILRQNGVLLIACEKSKIHYYLKNFRDIKNFKKFLADLNFDLVSVDQSSQWICYQIVLQ